MTEPTEPNKLLWRDIYCVPNDPTDYWLKLEDVIEWCRITDVPEYQILKRELRIWKYIHSHNKVKYILLSDVRGIIREHITKYHPAITVYGRIVKSLLEQRK